MIKRVLEIFESLTAVPRGSGNMKQIADFCEEFAVKNSLKYLRDGADNIIIFKDGTNEAEEPIILQGHLDMVCQQASDSSHDFLKNGPEIVIDGDFIRANKTTLGADNGIAVAMIMAILESNTLKHPPIEAVFTTDEEIGLIGAAALDTSSLKSKRLINLDSEDDDTITVSCAGGSDFQMVLPLEVEPYKGSKIKIKLFGLKGGHSGVEIDKGRVNANVLAGRFLNFLYTKTDFRICDINGGDKANAITPECTITLAASSKDFVSLATEYFDVLKGELLAREPDLSFEISVVGETDTTFSKALTEKIIYTLVCAPNGVLEMSADINGLVETSLNLGILKTSDEGVLIDFALRSNKSTALKYLEERLITFASMLQAEIDTFGHYPPWEYKANSELQKIYSECFYEHYGFEAKVEAIHAGLECGVFDGKIEGLTAISVGPQMYDVHTVNERLSVSSTENFFELLIKVIKVL